MNVIMKKAYNNIFVNFNFNFFLGKKVINGYKEGVRLKEGKHQGNGILVPNPVENTAILLKIP